MQMFLVVFQGCKNVIANENKNNFVNNIMYGASSRL